LLDPAQDAFLATLAQRVSIPTRTLGNGTGTQQALTLLADALVARPQGTQVSAGAASKIVSAFDAGKLLSISGSSPRPASLALLLVAPVPEASASPSASPPATDPQQLLAGFAQNLDDTAVGAVVVGPTDAALDGGVLELIRGDKAERDAVSTVDGAEAPRAAIATVLALVEQADGGAGSYGADSAGAEAPVPTVSPATS
jgi:hypothetical protein